LRVVRSRNSGLLEALLKGRLYLCGKVLVGKAHRQTLLVFGRALMIVAQCVRKVNSGWRQFALQMGWRRLRWSGETGSAQAGLGHSFIHPKRSDKQIW
jgi:hypothetical protein